MTDPSMSFRALLMSNRMGIGANSYNSAAQDSAKQTVIVVDCRGGAALWVLLGVGIA